MFGLFSECNFEQLVLISELSHYPTCTWYCFSPPAASLLLLMENSTETGLARDCFWGSKQVLLVS
jgi:hypothetical protein